MPFPTKHSQNTHKNFIKHLLTEISSTVSLVISANTKREFALNFLPSVIYRTRSNPHRPTTTPSSERGGKHLSHSNQFNLPGKLRIRLFCLFSNLNLINIGLRWQTGFNNKFFLSAVCMFCWWLLLLEASSLYRFVGGGKTIGAFLSDDVFKSVNQRCNIRVFDSHRTHVR